MEKKTSQDEQKLTDVLKKFAPGTSVRSALNDILGARMGALIVVDKEGLSNVSSGGFGINARFTPQRLVELGKMDGAIILSSDMKRILSANILLSPSLSMRTSETGTRHQAAERIAKQIKTVAIAVSERKHKITLYYCDERYELESTSEILRRTTESLQILEKQREMFDEAMINLNVLEINNFVTINDICHILQRIEIIKRISDTIKRNLIELGKDGTIVSMRLKELTMNVSPKKELILKDYFRSKYSRIETMLNNMNFDFLIETPNISRMLFEEVHDRPIPSRGFRILSRANLLDKDVRILMDYFKTLDKVFEADREALLGVFKNENLVNSLLSELDTLKKKILAGKAI